MSDLTCDEELLAEGGFALFLHRDSALIVSRIGGPGGAEFIRDRVFFGGRGVDEGTVPRDLEGVGEVRDVDVYDDDVAGDVHWRPALNGGAWLDVKANAVYDERCRVTKRKYQPVSVSYLCKANFGDSPEHKITAKVCYFLCAKGEV